MSMQNETIATRRHLTVLMLCHTDTEFITCNVYNMLPFACIIYKEEGKEDRHYQKSSLPLNWSKWNQDKYLLPIQGCLEGQNPVRIGVDCRETVACSFNQHN